MDPQTGRFASADPYAGSILTPMSLQPYLYADDNPATLVDPTGRQTLVEVEVSMTIDTDIEKAYDEALFTH